MLFPHKEVTDCYTMGKKIEKNQNVKATWFNRFSELVLTLLWKCSGNLTHLVQLLVTNIPVRSTVKSKLQRRVLYLHKTHKFLLSKQTQLESVYFLIFNSYFISISTLICVFGPYLSSRGCDTLRKPVFVFPPSCETWEFCFWGECANPYILAKHNV